ncbi:MAG TPA: shikimate dehydrogenase [Elusimicrobia bacterium]|nr:shikimate dehydrogenase [Elusimicrobiota bacterium]HBT60290.1 shikimate dehydrogenase [Elusimicrobiota bacterium]
MARSVRIGGRCVGDGHPCFIIAEAGSNHDGNLSQALRLIDVAASAGADAVKFQLFRAQTLYPKLEVRPRYLKSLGVQKSIYRVIEDMEMPWSWLPRLYKRCQRRGILFMATPFDEDCADRLRALVPAFKIASYEMTHAPLLRHVARLGKPLILSTGAADAGEIDRALKGLPRSRVCLMQCTAKYPAPPKSLNLNVIPWLKARYKVPVGLSDHSADCAVAPVAAAALGANLLEKHFTLSRRLRGPDHSYALEPDELGRMVASVRQAESMLGSGVKVPHSVELELREYRRGIFTLLPIPEGARLTRDNLAVLRRGGRRDTGLDCGLFPKLLGRRARQSLPAHHLLEKIDVR